MQQQTTFVRAKENEQSICKVLTNSQPENKKRSRKKWFKFRKNKVGCLNEEQNKKRIIYLPRSFLAF